VSKRARAERAQYRFLYSLLSTEVVSAIVFPASRCRGQWKFWTGLIHLELPNKRPPFLHQTSAEKPADYIGCLLFSFLWAVPLAFVRDSAISRTFWQHNLRQIFSSFIQRKSLFPKRLADVRNATRQARRIVRSELIVLR
jgi:hypothetical protein